MEVVHQESPHQLSEKFRHMISPGDTGASAFDLGMLSRMGPNTWQPVAAAPTLIIHIDNTEVRILGAPVPVPAWFRSTVEAAVRLSFLEPGWDSYGAHPVTRQALEAGLGALLEVLRPQTPPPSVVPVSAGGLQFEWHRNELDVEIELSREGVPKFIVADLSLDSEIEADWSDLSTLQEAIAKLSD